MKEEVDLMQCNDAHIWAKEFMWRFGGWRRIKIDEELMLTWFASCFMRGYDTGRGAIASCGDELAHKIAIENANTYAS